MVGCDDRLCRLVLADCDDRLCLGQRWRNWRSSLLIERVVGLSGPVDVRRSFERGPFLPLPRQPLGKLRICASRLSRVACLPHSVADPIRKVRPSICRCHDLVSVTTLYLFFPMPFVGGIVPCPGERLVDGFPSFRDRLRLCRLLLVFAVNRTW